MLKRSKNHLWFTFFLSALLLGGAHHCAIEDLVSKLFGSSGLVVADSSAHDAHQHSDTHEHEHGESHTVLIMSSASVGVGFSKLATGFSALSALAVFIAEFEYTRLTRVSDVRCEFEHLHHTQHIQCLSYASLAPPKLA